MASTSSNHSQKRHGGKKTVEMEEIVRHMSNLPSYLERGRPIQDRALNFGVMDWGRLEKWQYQNRQQGVIGNDKYSSSSSNSSLLSSTDGSSPHSSKAQSFSPALLKPDHVALRSHLNITPEEISSKLVESCSGNLHKLQDFKDDLVNHSSKKKTTNRSRTKSRDFKMNDLNTRNLHESKSSLDDLESFHTASSSSSSKGKMKAQDPSYGTCDGALFGRHKTLVPLLRDQPGNSLTNDDIPRSIPSKIKVGNGKDSWNIEADSERNPSRSFSDENEFNVFSKKANTKTVTIAANKPRTAEPPTVSHRPHTSQLKRLLDPLFPSKATHAETSHEDSKIKTKVKLDFGSCKEVKVDDFGRNNKTTESSSTYQEALFQMAIKNGRPLFTFTVDNISDILAATVRSLNGKDSSNSWIYTFFEIHEMKKKKGGWLSHGMKGSGQGYLPNVTAQMKVSNPSNGTTREFVLSSVDPGRLDHEILDAEPKDELAAIVARFLRRVDQEGDEDCFSTTVILPGGHHGIPSKGEPSPLIERWRSGGVCDCGGWDIGCRLRTLGNKVQSDRISSSPEAHMASGNFELFFQEDVANDRPCFSLSRLKEGIFSVGYNSSLSLLQVFSICISVIECRKSSQPTELRTYVAKQVDDDDEAQVTYTSLPPVSPVGRV